MDTTAGRNLLLLNGSKYFLDDLVRHFKKTSPVIDLDIALINDEKNPAHVVTYDPPREPQLDDVVIVLKQGSKFTVLFGKELVAESIKAGNVTLKKVRLISTVMLKQVRVPEPAEQTSTPSWAAPPPRPAPPEFQNRPRFNDSRTSPQFRSRTAAYKPPPR